MASEQSPAANLPDDVAALYEAQRQGEARLRAVFATMAEGLIVNDAAGRVVEANDAACRILGVPRERVVGRTGDDAQWPAWREDGTPWPADEFPGVTAQRTGRPQREQVMRLGGADPIGGPERWISVNALPLAKDDPVLPGGVVVSFIDITARMQLAAQNARHLQEIVDLYDLAPCGYHSLGPDGLYLRINATELSWLGCRHDEVVGRCRPTDFLDERGREAFRLSLPRILAGESLHNLPLTLYGRHGQRREVLLNATPVFDAQRRVVMTRSVLHDVTELQQARQQHQASQAHGAELAALLAERTEMLAVLAHEVRQPLHNALAALQGARGTRASRSAGQAPDAARGGEALGRTHDMLREVIDSVDNTLAVAELLTRSGPIERGDTELQTLLDMAIADLPPAERDRVRIRHDTRARSASMDMSLMRLALRNLLANALAYSPPGSAVTVALGDSDEPLALLIDVQDQGAGIEPALQARLFQRGVSGSRAQRGPGHGLGLYIVHRVMELHRGRVQVLATGPGGTTLRLQLNQDDD